MMHFDRWRWANSFLRSLVNKSFGWRRWWNWWWRCDIDFLKQEEYYWLSDASRSWWIVTFGSMISSRHVTFEEFPVWYEWGIETGGRCCLTGFGSCDDTTVDCSKNGLIRCTKLPLTAGATNSLSLTGVLIKDKRGFGCGFRSCLMKTKWFRNQMLLIYYWIISISCHIPCRFNSGHHRSSSGTCFFMFRIGNNSRWWWWCCRWRMMPSLYYSWLTNIIIIRSYRWLNRSSSISRVRCWN